MQMQIQIPPQRVSQSYDLAAALSAQQQQHPSAAAAAAAAAVAAANGYAYPARRPSLPFGADVYDPATQQFRSQTQYDMSAQHFQPRGSIGSLSAYSSSSSPYTSSSNMPTTPTGMEHPPVVNPWFIPFTMGGMPVGHHPMQYWLGKSTGARQRTNQACEKCRDRKTKCTGERPTCHRCSIRGLQCEYASEHRIRGPTKNRKRNAASVDFTNSGPSLSPHFSTPDKTFQHPSSEGDSSVSPVDTAPTADEPWAKAEHDHGLFDQWIEQNGSTLGLSIHDSAKQEDTAAAYTDAVDPATLHPNPALARFSASMPHLRMDYDAFNQHATLPEPLPSLHHTAHQLPDAQPDHTADYGWSQQFDHSQDFPHYPPRPDSLSGPNQLPENHLPLTLPHQSATYGSDSRQSFGFNRAQHMQAEHGAREPSLLSPVPVPSSEGFWFALSAKVPHPIPEDNKADADAKSQGESSTTSSTSYSWTREEPSPSGTTDSDSNAVDPSEAPVSGEDEGERKSEDSGSKDSLFDETPKATA